MNWASPGPILADARRARRRGARIVIVNLHWGTEYVQPVTPQQRALARRLTRSPAIDAIVGQHAHVVQPIRRVNGKPVVFGEGNLISNQTAACCSAAAQDGLIALIDFVVRPGRRVRAPRIRYVPTWVRHPDLTVLPAAPGSASWNRTVSVAGRRPASATPAALATLKGSDPLGLGVRAMRIRAAVLEEFAKPLVVQDVELDGPEPGEVLVRLAACGVCHTDLYTASGADPSGYAPDRARTRGRRRGRGGRRGRDAASRPATTS